MSKKTVVFLATGVAVAGAIAGATLLVCKKRNAAHEERVKRVKSDLVK